MPRQLASLALAASLLLPVGCATVTTGADFTPETRFPDFKTFSWGPRDDLPTGDPRLDNNPFFDARVRSAVEWELTTRGLKPVDNGADLNLHYHISIQQRIDVFAVDRIAGYDYPGQARDSALSVYDEGTLIVDMVETGSRQVIWRGWAKTDLGGVIDRPDRLKARVDEAVAAMFRRYPHSR